MAPAEQLRLLPQKLLDCFGALRHLGDGSAGATAVGEMAANGGSAGIEIEISHLLCPYQERLAVRPPHGRVLQNQRRPTGLGTK